MSATKFHARLILMYVMWYGAELIAHGGLRTEQPDGRQLPHQPGHCGSVRHRGHMRWLALRKSTRQTAHRHACGACKGRQAGPL